jgi:hypothetical protein
MKFEESPVIRLVARMLCNGALRSSDLFAILKPPFDFWRYNTTRAKKIVDFRLLADAKNVEETA